MKKREIVKTIGKEFLAEQRKDGKYEIICHDLNAKMRSDAMVVYDDSVLWDDCPVFDRKSDADRWIKENVSRLI